MIKINLLIIFVALVTNSMLKASEPPPHNFYERPSAFKPVAKRTRIAPYTIPARQNLNVVLPISSQAQSSQSGQQTELQAYRTQHSSVEAPRFSRISQIIHPVDVPVASSVSSAKSSQKEKEPDSPEASTSDSTEQAPPPAYDISYTNKNSLYRVPKSTTRLSASFLKGMGDQGLYTLASEPWAENLTALAIAGNGITPSDIQFLVVFEKLIDLDISYNPLGDAGIAKLAEWHGASDLQSLGIAGTGITFAGMSHLAAFKSLKSLALGYNELSYKELLELAQTPIASQLVTLDLTASHLSVEAFKVLATKFENLRGLILQLNILSTNELAALAQAPFAKELTLLDLRKTGTSKYSRSKLKKLFPKATILL